MLHGANSREKWANKSSDIKWQRSVVPVPLSLYGSAAAGAATVQDALSNLRNLSPVQRKAVIEENARKEKDLVWYTSMGLTDFPKNCRCFREKPCPT